MISACTVFDFECLPSSPSALPGQNCTDTLGTATCGDGQACVQEMSQGVGNGLCETYCDPTLVDPCGQGNDCVEVGVGLLKGSPVIHVCQVTSSDASIPIVGDDSGPPVEVDGGNDSGIPDAGSHRFFDGITP
jgi:hypothetical protein